MTEVTYRDYNDVLRALAAGRAPSPTVLDRLERLTDDVAALSLVARAAATEREADLDAAHRAFLVGLPSTDVIFSFARESLQFMVTREDPSAPPEGSRARLYAWYWGLWGRALVYLYESTGQTRFLDLFVEVYDQMLLRRDDALGLVDDVRGEVVAGWGSPLENGKRSSEVTGAGLIALPVCEFLGLLRREPKLRRYAEHQDRYLESVVETLDVLMDEMIPLPEIGGGYFRVPGSPEQVEALNHMAVYGAATAYTYRLSGLDRFREMTEALAAFFRAVTTSHPEGVVTWTYNPTPEDFQLGGRGEQVWKAGVTIELPLAAHRCGIVYDDEDIERLADTFVRGALRPEAQMNTWIAPDHTLVQPTDVSMNLHGIVSTWLYLADRRPDVMRAFLAVMANNPVLFPGGWFGGSRHMLLGLALLIRARAGLSWEFLPADKPKRREQRPPAARVA